MAQIARRERRRRLPSSPSLTRHDSCRESFQCMSGFLVKLQLCITERRPRGRLRAKLAPSPCVRGEGRAWSPGTPQVKRCGGLFHHVQINAERSPWQEENDAGHSHHESEEPRRRESKRQAASGEKAVLEAGRPRFLISDFMDSIPWTDVARRLGLSGREIDIARLLCQGRKAGTIAGLLPINIGTVKTHLKRLYKKCRVHDRASLVALLFWAAREDG